MSCGLSAKLIAAWNSASRLFWQQVPSHRTLIRLVAFLEITGGIFGSVFLFTQLALNQVPIKGVLFAGLVLYTCAVFAGWALWCDWSIGYVASTFLQIVQLVKAATPQLIYMVNFGGDVMVTSMLHNNGGNGWLGMAIYAQVGPQLIVDLSPRSDAPLGFGVSLVSCLALLLFLARLCKTGTNSIPASEVGAASRVECRRDSGSIWAASFPLKLAIGVLILLVAACAGLIGPR